MKSWGEKLVGGKFCGQTLMRLRLAPDLPGLREETGGEKSREPWASSDIRNKNEVEVQKRPTSPAEVLGEGSKAKRSARPSVPIKDCTIQQCRCWAQALAEALS